MKFKKSLENVEAFGLKFLANRIHNCDHLKDRAASSLGFINVHLLRDGALL